MIGIQKQESKSFSLNKQRSYNEIISFLDLHWTIERSSLDLMKKLDKQLGSPSKKVPSIYIAGINGKSLTSHFTSLVLKEEGLTVGSLNAPHILNYNERISLNQEIINNKVFAELANEVLDAADELHIIPHSLEVLTLMGLLYFSKQSVDVALLEINNENSWEPATICTPIIMGITRVTQNGLNASSVDETIKKMLDVINTKTWVVSADQSKINLQLMTDYVAQKNSQWAMPIRKLSPLAYPFEQLHGRCAALAERIASLFVNNVIAQDSTIIQDSLLIKQKGQRGRPTLEAKRQTELNPKRTIEHFWKEISTTLPGRFHLLEKEKPSILLDNAANIDAFQNLLLGIRLLHYQRPLKGLAIIIGTNDSYLAMPEFLKMIS